MGVRGFIPGRPVVGEWQGPITFHAGPLGPESWGGETPRSRGRAERPEEERASGRSCVRPNGRDGITW
jgi:hypothetical protein